MSDVPVPIPIRLKQNVAETLRTFEDDARDQQICDDASDAHRSMPDRSPIDMVAGTVTVGTEPTSQIAEPSGSAYDVQPSDKLDPFTRESRVDEESKREVAMQAFVETVGKLKSSAGPGDTNALYTLGRAIMVLHKVLVPTAKLSGRRYLGDAVATHFLENVKRTSDTDWRMELGIALASPSEFLYSGDGVNNRVIGNYAGHLINQLRLTQGEILAYQKTAKTTATDRPDRSISLEAGPSLLDSDHPISVSEELLDSRKQPATIMSEMSFASKPASTARSRRDRSTMERDTEESFQREKASKQRDQSEQERRRNRYHASNTRHENELAKPSRNQSTRPNATEGGEIDEQKDKERRQNRRRIEAEPGKYIRHRTGKGLSIW